MEECASEGQSKLSKATQLGGGDWASDSIFVLSGLFAEDMSSLCEMVGRPPGSSGNRKTRESEVTPVLSGSPLLLVLSAKH